jgi:serine/threonine protein kinase
MMSEPTMGYQIIDFENAAHLPKGRCIKGMLAGNDNWRSPEGHFRGELNKPSDMYLFGAVVSGSRVNCGERQLSLTSSHHVVHLCCAWPCIFGLSDDFLKHTSKGILPALHRLQLQVSYFGDKDGLNGLMKYVGDMEINCQILGMLWDERKTIPYKPFSTWADVEDVSFRDVVQRMMNLDPAKRIMARQVLGHTWFAGI